MSLNLSHLNIHQHNAVTYGPGPLLILAGAGSGKTSTIAYRIAFLIVEKNISGNSILGLSFTNKAATELKNRVKKLVTASAGKKATRGLTISTFHSLCAQILRSHASKIGFQDHFTILDQNDQIDVLRQVLKNIRVDDRRFDPDVILFEIGQVKNRFMSQQEAETFLLQSRRLSADYALVTASAFVRYQEQLRVQNAMDFDDLTYYTVQLLEKNLEVREAYNVRYRYILVDEYQDTNAAQFKIIQLLTEKNQNLCVVGDDDQSIYAWRGADPSHILGFRHHYPKAQVVALEQNYRSTSKILEAANSVIEKNKNRYPKKLWSDRGSGEPLISVILKDDRAEADFVGEEILKRNQNNNHSWSDFAILYRSNSQSRVFEEALRRRAIPYKIVGGISFLARKEVKNILAYWKCILNPRDDASLRRIINWPARGIGKTSLEALNQIAFDQNISLFEVIENREQLVLNLQAKAVQALLHFKSLIADLRQKLEIIGNDPALVSVWAKNSLDRFQAKQAIEEESDDPLQAARKWENVEELVHSIGQYRVENLDSESSPDEKIPGGLILMRDFLNRMTLDAQEEKDRESDEDRTKKNQVTLLTLHGAKGLEFCVVFLVGMEEGFLPHKRTLDAITDLGEERRLCYVGITRARDQLFLIRVKNGIRYGKPVLRVASRFLEEIPKNVLTSVNESGIVETSSQVDAQKAHEMRVKSHLAEIRAKLLKPNPI